MFNFNIKMVNKWPFYAFPKFFYFIGVLFLDIKTE